MEINYKDAFWQEFQSMANQFLQNIRMDMNTSYCDALKGNWERWWTRWKGMFVHPTQVVTVIARTLNKTIAHNSWGEGSSFVYPC